MIFDQIKHASRYYETNNNIKIALEFIKKNALGDKLIDGKYELIPGEVTAFVLTKETVKQSEAKMEIHKKYMDIHYLINGCEVCGIAPIMDNPEGVIPYDEQSDNGFFECENSFQVKADEGEFYAVWPMEPHRPLCNAYEESMPVRKIICKVKVD